MKTYTGKCHCGAIQFEIEADLANVISCNCSHCAMTGALYHFINKDKFKLLAGADMLREYFFGDKTIRYLFCNHCGTQPFAEGATFPQMAIDVRSLSGVDVSTLTITPFNGKDL